jgi:hypothetical protein
MASEEGQRVITQTTAEYPLHKGMESDRGLKPFERTAPAEDHAGRPGQCRRSHRAGT